MFGSLFKAGRFLDAELEDWQLQAWAWLMRHRGGMAMISRTPLASPSREHFPPTEAVGEARAAHVFECVRRQMSMTDNDYPCRLEARTPPRADAQVGVFWVLESPGAVNGTFDIVEGQPVICYADSLVDQPMRLVATLAHELSHYLILDIEEAPPGGWEAHELATDLTVAYRGLGVFCANTAFSFEQHGDTFSQGWRSQRNGYLSPRSWAFAIAVFLALKGEPIDAAGPWLKGEVAGLTRAAGRYLAKNPHFLEPLRAIG